MDPTLREYLDVTFRWLHVVAGVVWIGHLYFFNFVNAQLAKSYDADSKKKVVPVLMPRALYFFRWGALFTWITGLLLLSLVYHTGSLLVGPDAPEGAKGMAIGIGYGVILFSFFIYDALWKSPLGKNETAGAVVSWLLFTGLAFGLSRVMAGRSLFIHLGATLGTIMMMNVWMRIWPAQKKIIRGIMEKAPAPGPEVPALAGLRSKHNVYMSLPVIFFMATIWTFPTGYGNDFNWAIASGVVLVGWALAKFLYTKAASQAPAEV